jgi:pyrroloquinoline quinone biosynthesis protein B
MSRSIIFNILLLVVLQGGVVGQNAQLLVLGSSQDAGTPQVGCLKNCCSSIWDNPAYAKKVASVAFSDGKNFYLIDATPDLPAQYMAASAHYEGLSFGGIFITHAHIGHYTGLMYLGRESMGAKDIPVYCMPRMKQFLEENGPWNQLVTLGNIQLIALQEEREYPLINGVSVKPLKVPHRDEYSETVGFLINAEKSFLYLPDIDKWDVWERPIEAMIQTVDHAFIDATFFDGDELTGRDISEVPHPFVVESIARFEGLSESDRNKIQFIHLNHTNPLHDTSSAAYRQVIDFGAHVAQEGLIVPLND